VTFGCYTSATFFNELQVCDSGGNELLVTFWFGNIVLF